MAHIYGDGTDHTVRGTQYNTYNWRRKALIETEDEAYFAQMGGSVGQPKHMGKELVRYAWIPLIDDANINDQGIDASGAVIADGNLYGSKKDPGTILGKLPNLSEDAGRVNRVGMTRREIRGDISQFGFFYEWTRESMIFDTDKDLNMHLNREATRGARKLNEDIVQIDLLSAASTIRYAGDATSIDTVGYDSDTKLNSVVTYGDLIKLNQSLTAVRCPMNTKAITGSTLTDVKNIARARYMFVAPDMLITLKKMVDFQGNPAFVDIENYAKMTPEGKYVNALNGEIGAIAGFRIIEVPEMLFWEGGGEALGADTSYVNDGSNYNVYPMLVVGDESFSHIKFQGGMGTGDKFKIITRAPVTVLARYDY